MKRDILIILSLIVLTVIAFFGVTHCGLTNLDDNVYVTENAHVLGGLSWTNFKWAWTTFYQATYIPLTWLSLMLDATLFGAGPRGFHWMNVAFHAANVIFVYVFFRRATGAVWRSAVVAAVFAVHPLRVESVAWVVERKDLLSGFFAFVALLAYLRYSRSLGEWDYVLVVALFGASLLAKQAVMTLPLLMLVLDIWPLGRWIRGPQAVSVIVPRRTIIQLVLEKLPLLLALAADLVVTRRAQAVGEAVVSLATVPMKQRLANVPVAYALYLWKMVSFKNLAVYYPPTQWSVIQVSGAILLLIAVSGAVAWQWNRRPWLAVGWLWFLGVLAPMCGIVRTGYWSNSDRFVYVSGIGVLLMVVWSIPAGAVRRMPVLAVAAVVTLLGIMRLFTFVQVGYWRNSIALLTHDIAVAGTSPLAENNLGVAIIAQNNDYAAAISHFRVAVRLDPYYDELHRNLASALISTNQYAKAYPYLVAAVRLNPKSAVTHVLIAQYLVWKKRYDLAGNESRIAIQLDPTCAEAHNNYGVSLWRLGKLDEAADQFRLAMVNGPVMAQAKTNLEVILALKNTPAATTHAKLSSSTRPATGELQ